MGLGPCILKLYARLRRDGTFGKIEAVCELGSQGVWTPRYADLVDLFAAFGRQLPTPLTQWGEYINDSGTGVASSRHLHEVLGCRYTCIDIDGKHGAIPLDLNFDEVPGEHRGRYNLVTNHGTTEHVFNQFNAFRVMHDLTAPGGLMLHAVPLGTGYWDHGFFGYQPNLFEALAKYNDYECLGVWVNPHWHSDELIPLRSPDDLKGRLQYGPEATHLLVTLARKTRDAPFRMPLQHWYDGDVSPEIRARYTGNHA